MHNAQSFVTGPLPTSKPAPRSIDIRHVTRDALVDRVSATTSARLVLLRAPAGSGKTTLMGQYRMRLQMAGATTAWLRLGESDNDLSGFVKHLQAALKSLIPGDLASAPMPGTAPIGELAMMILDRIRSLRPPFALFLDDFESIRTPAVIDVVDQLLEALPSGGRLLIGTRERPALRLGRLRASGELLEIEDQDLRFSLDETRCFFDAAVSDPLAKESVELIHRKTEGWAAALWLVRLALERRQDHETFISEFSGLDAGLADYLVEEVLSRQSEPMRDLLLRSSVLEEISAPLCEALMPGRKAGSMLAQLISSNAFLTPIEGRSGCWRYHSLFASFLRSQLERDDPTLIPDLHRAAARAYLNQGRIVPAVDHSIQAGEKSEIVRLLKQEAGPLLKQGRFRLLARWFEALDPDTQRESALLSLSHVWAVSFTRGPRAAHALMQSLGVADSPRPRIRTHVPALRASLLLLLDRWEEGHEVARRALPQLPTISRYADAALIHAAAAASTVLGRFDAARQHLDLARRMQGRYASAFHQMYSEAIEGTIDLFEGRLRQARARFRLAMQATQDQRLDVSDSNAWAGLLYAESAYEANERLQAMRLLQVYLPLARDAWLPDHTLLGYVMLSRIAFSQGDVERAFETLAELEYLGHERELGRLAAGARLERSRLLLMQGYGDAAKVELDRANDVAVWERVATHCHLAHDCEDLAIGRVRWSLAFEDPVRAEVALTELLEQAQRSGRVRRMMKLRLLLAAALTRKGDEHTARPIWAQVIQWARFEGAVRIIADEGSLVADMVTGFDDQFRSHDDPDITEYLQRLRDALDVREAATTAIIGEPPALLTPSETRILQLLAEGCSNKALARKLLISDSTVRTHLRNINHKLGAANRTEAVAKGRRLGAIH